MELPEWSAVLAAPGMSFRYSTRYSRPASRAALRPRSARIQVELAERSEPGATQLVMQNGLPQAAAAWAGAVSRVAGEAQSRRASPVREQVLPASSPKEPAEQQQFWAAPERLGARKQQDVVKAYEPQGPPDPWR
jgi:hypothetical protein